MDVVQVQITMAVTNSPLANPALKETRIAPVEVARVEANRMENGG